MPEWAGSARWRSVFCTFAAGDRARHIACRRAADFRCIGLSDSENLGHPPAGNSASHSLTESAPRGVSAIHAVWRSPQMLH